MPAPVLGCLPASSATPPGLEHQCGTRVGGTLGIPGEDDTAEYVAALA